MILSRMVLSPGCGEKDFEEFIYEQALEQFSKLPA